jgi:hypothetical protein
LKAGKLGLSELWVGMASGAGVGAFDNSEDRMWLTGSTRPAEEIPNFSTLCYCSMSESDKAIKVLFIQPIYMAAEMDAYGRLAE